ncbi:MAG: ribonuclease P protein component 1 [Caldisphaeraceae archaeon]|nr:ribonuclease P protein component 1 [Caldisphaeraceae archaeon]MEB3691371.1 ribonuclease P protein component 1 [Caldisphaeraceae archaeon]MEB3798530.1 ribonuclease P protein component 1 [Caldisphaeraceae archaeon]
MRGKEAGKASAKMKITAENIFYHELIGLHLVVLRHLDPSLEGIKGKVLYETKYTIKVWDGTKEKTILKSGARFLFYLPDGREVIVDGERIVGAPEERAKKYMRK